MEKIERILFPVELSSISELIAPHVAIRSEKFGAEVHVMHVVQSPEDWARLYAVAPEALKAEAELVHEAEQMLDDFCTQHLPEAIQVVLTGDTVDSIIDYICDKDISMVVMGSHGRKGLDRILMGSVAMRVLRRSPVPVLIVNPYRHEAEKRPAK